MQWIGFGALFAGLLWALDSAQRRAKETVKIWYSSDAVDTRESDEPQTVTALRGRDGLMDYDDIYKRMGTRYGVDWRLLKAVARVESNERPQAVNPNDPSMGLMQILCTGPDSDGFCTNKFNIDPWPVKKEDLFNPELNVQLAAQILEWNIDNYGFPRGVAIYNRWASRLDPVDGPFGNQDYVDKVLAEYRGLGG